MERRALIYYFTGTGNAWRLARLAAREFEKQGCRTTIVPVEHGRIHPDHKDMEYIGFACPVLGFGLPQMMARFLRRLPRGARRKAFVLIAMGNSERVRVGSRQWSVPPTEGVSMIQAIVWLVLKGYRVRNAMACEMPTNWILAVNPPGEKDVKVLYERTAERIEKFIDSLLREEKSLSLIKPWWAIPCALVYCLFVFIGRRIAGKWFVVNKRCDSCRQCSRQCPQGTIKWRSGRPYWGWDCQQCFRCINLCPQHAIEVSALTLIGTFIPLIVMHYIYRHIPSPFAGQSRPLAMSAHVLCYFILAAVAVGVIHHLQCSSLTGKYVPRWPLTGHRARYKEPDFEAPERGEPA